MTDKSGWTKVKLGDVVEHVKDIVNIETCGLEHYLGGEHFNTNDLHVNGKGVIEGSTIGPAFIMRFKPGQVLLVSRNPHLRKMAVVDFEGICSNVTYVCETKSDLLLQKFLPFVMRSDDFWRFAEANKRGSTNFYLNWTDFAQYEFSLPPVEEQKRITELLWAADDLIQKQYKCILSLFKIKDVLMNEMIEKVRSGDNFILLGDVIDYKCGQVDPKTFPYSEMPLVAPNHVESNTGRIINLQTASEQNAISGKYFFEKGEVVYSKIRPSLNKVFIAKFNGLCSADMYPLKPNYNKITLHFLYYLLSSSFFVSYAEICSVRTSIPKLNRLDMSKFSFNCPDLEYQNYFCKKILSLDNSIDETQKHLIKCKDLLSNLTNNSLGGAIDV